VLTITLPSALSNVISHFAVTNLTKTERLSNRMPASQPASPLQLFTGRLVDHNDIIRTRGDIYPLSERLRVTTASVTMHVYFTQLPHLLNRALRQL